MAKHFEFKSIVFTFLLSCAMWTVLFVACNELSGKYEETPVKDSTHEKYTIIHRWIAGDTLCVVATCNHLTK